MQEQLITFETAKLAKQKGFNEICIDSFNGEKPTNRFDIELKKYYTIKDVQSQFEVSNSTLAAGYIARPTQSLLQKWLREKHFISVEPYIECFESDNLGFYNCVVIYNINNKSNITYLGAECTHKNYHTYEDALDAGLIEGLNLIRNENT